MQRKVAVGVSDDVLEVEADRIADRILTTNPAAPSDPVDVLRASSSAGWSPEIAAPASVDRAVAGSGQPLERWLRQDMENRFGHNFSDVRIHVGAAADRSARDVEAIAYTVGSNIVFGAGHYAPATETGRRLLAHELTHVLQQRESPATIAPGTRDRGATPRAGSAARIQRQPRRKEASARSGGATVQVFSVPTEIYWAYFWYQKSPPALHYAQLLVNFSTFQRRDQFTAKWIADRCVRALESGTSLKFKAGKRDALLAVLQEQFSQAREQEMLVNILMFDPAGGSWFTYFEEKSFEDQVAEAAAGKSEENHGWVYTVVARGDLGSDPTPEGNDIPVDTPGDREVAAARAREAARQHQRLEAAIERLRRLDTPPPNLPDRVVLWQSERDQLWYLNVWIFLDTAGTQKKGRSIRLEPGESTADLLKRVQEAIEKTREGMRAEEERRRQLEMPPWALKLKRELEIRLGPKKGGEVPDGLSLVFENAGASTNGPVSSKAPSNEPPRVLLHVWVERDGRRNSASVPLLEKTNVDELEKYVRHLTVMLREFEKAPDSMELTRWDLGGVDSPMPPFKARIVPQDLRPDKVTIAGGNNKFGMLLNYEEQYQSGGAGQAMADMHVASKLYSQTIFFIWRVFKVPADIKPNPDEKPAPTEWAARWEWLYKHYNPGATISGDTITWTDTTRPMPMPPSPEVTTSESSFVGALVSPLAAIARDKHEVTREPSGRVRMEDAEGEYLVFCETRHRPFGEYDLKRASAYAYYPLRTEKKETIVGPLVTQTVQEIETARKEIAAIDAVLAGDDETKRPLLQAMRSSAQAHLDVLLLKEKSGLVETTAAEIQEATKKLGLVTKLRMRLPGLIDTAKANQKNQVQPDSPSKMLANEPDLLAIYWQLIQEQKTAESYEQELTDQIAELTKVNERASGYSGRFKPDAACVYTPEAVFVSEVDGNIYPLVLMIGEAQPIFPGETAYTVADVTTEDTKDAFRGKSHKRGDEGHVAAIDDAFDEFGSKATYGEGWIGVRMPEGPSEETCRDRHKHGIQFYRSKEGIIEKVWKILGLLAAVVGVAALVATGVGAPAAAALLGAAAGLIGAAVSLRNIAERQRKGTLKADAELALDILGVIGVGELAASAKLANLSRTVRGFETFERFEKFIAVYRLSSEGATAILIPLKLHDDISRIKAMHLAPDVEAKLIEEAWVGALQSGLMFLGGSIGSRAFGKGGGKSRGGAGEADYAAIRRQAEMMSLEQVGEYQSMQERGWIDADGKWTSAAPDVVRRGNVPDPGSPEVLKAAREGVEHVNEHPELIREGADGKRHAKVDEEHEIVEVEAPAGLACEYHSPGGPRIECPEGMGSSRHDVPGQEEGPAAKKGPTTAPPVEPGPTGPARPDLPADNLITVRKRHHGALREKKQITANRASAVYEKGEAQRLIEETNHKLEAYRNRHPKAGPENDTIRKFSDRLSNLEKTVATHDETIRRVDERLPKLEAEIVELEAIKKQYEGSKPWLNIKIGAPESSEKAQGFVGEIEMGVGMQSLGFEPMGKTVRAEEMLIPQDFDAALQGWDGQTGLDGVYKRPDPENPGEIEYWVGESKTETVYEQGKPRTDPRGTVGKLKRVTSGERQLSDEWLEPRLDNFGLSATELRELKTAFKNGKVKKFYSFTDAHGTRFFEVHNVPGSRTEVTIKGEIHF